MGKREAQKAAIRDRIVESATALFKAKGYRSTTVNEIAAGAGIAWATVYKYFPTKEEIVVAVIAPGLERIFNSGQALIECTELEPSVAMTKLLRSYMDWRDGWEDRIFQLELSTAGLIRDSEVMYESANKANDQARKQIYELLLAYQSQERLRSPIDLSMLTSVIYSMFNDIYMKHITHEDVSKEQTAIEIDGFVFFLFSELKL